MQLFEITLLLLAVSLPSLRAYMERMHARPQAAHRTSVRQPPPLRNRRKSATVSAARLWPPRFSIVSLSYRLPRESRQENGSASAPHPDGGSRREGREPRGHVERGFTRFFHPLCARTTGLSAVARQAAHQDLSVAGRYCVFQKTRRFDSLTRVLWMGDI